MKRVQRADGLRQLLLSDRQHDLKRWPTGQPDPFAEALCAGAPVAVSAAQLMRALMHAGLPHEQFCYGRSDYGKTFVLDERDQLTEHNGG
ncbi:hypothetical protein [Mycobacterium talmoniae]|uniref:Uncharacterized protein n=1 Tax=Mycobacterium talmoniae TaxID=1858794 RepID=A0A1S1NM81_9MYCO|nr:MULTISPECIES: hypothetical protein [Mycobacterium]OHV03887.1 hypothetical protein BKN37_12715 [Mycobacterium talmoniae]PQM48068.1 hypothetical protein C1Y40_01703 [Mycobacterium talmoniae]TDH51571.1 hypothetical protein E2F47_15935 [Mycobacterium eburneum]